MVFDVPADFLPILEVLAELAFDGMKKPFLARLASHLGYDAPAGADFFDLLILLVSKILEPTTELLMEILTKAMAEIEARKFRGENVFLDVEDLHLYLDRDDREAFDKAQKKHKMAAKELHDFERRYREKRNELMPVEPVKVKKGKGKGGKGKGKRGQDEVKVLPEGEVLQRDVKQYTPPGASIWRGNTKGTWNGHFPPFRRISCPWKLIGCRKSCLEVLRRLWVQYLRSKGQTLADCTVQGMFTVAEVEQDDIEVCTD